eukprot:scpid96208/ scgid6541/ 
MNAVPSVDLLSFSQGNVFGHAQCTLQHKSLNPSTSTKPYRKSTQAALNALVDHICVRTEDFCLCTSASVCSAGPHPMILWRTESMLSSWNSSTTRHHIQT